MYDVIVIGLGGMGSPTAYELAARGKKVLGLDRHAPGHDRGSSHGGSRLIRQAYFEDPAYVPLVLRAYELWAGLEAASGRDLMDLCGGLMLGHRGSMVLEGSLEAPANTTSLASCSKRKTCVAASRPFIPAPEPAPSTKRRRGT